MINEVTNIKGLLIITPDIYSDNRGYFLESYQKERYIELGIPELVQDNESLSSKDVLRGLHFQLDPDMQGKLVRVVSGSAVDVVVDIRPDSETFGKHFKIILSSENKKQLWIPVGFAHGFLSLENDTRLLYKCSSFYRSESECTLSWNDSDVAIEWGVEFPLLSEKDSAGLSLSEVANLLKI